MLYEVITYFPKVIQEAGADAIELNIFILPTDMKRTSADNENIYMERNNFVQHTLYEVIRSDIDTILSLLESPTIGLAEIKTEIFDIRQLLGSSTIGLEEIKSEVANIEQEVSGIRNNFVQHTLYEVIRDSVLVIPALICTCWHFYELSQISSDATKTTAILDEISKLTSYISRISYAVAVNAKDPDTKAVSIGIMIGANVATTGLQTAEAIEGA